MISTWSLEQFEANNEYYYHCENYGVISASYGSVSKDMLFDFFDVKDGRLAKAVASSPIPDLKNKMGNTIWCYPFL